jgi:biopolymer transport protein ExbD/biopolymer transport protein TolR
MSAQSGNEFNEINITPLTDIFLVLLIIMMMMAPMFQSMDKNIKMPEINSGLSVEEDKVTVSITKNAEFFVDSEAVDPANLESKLTELINKSKDKILIVKADTSTKSKEIMKVIRAAQIAGYEKLTVAGEPLSTNQQEELENNKVKTSEDVDNSY